MAPSNKKKLASDDRRHEERAGGRFVPGHSGQDVRVRTNGLEERGLRAPGALISLDVLCPADLEGDPERLSMELGRVQRDYLALSIRHEQALVRQRESESRRVKLLQQMAGLQAEVCSLREEHRRQVRRFQQAEAEIRELSDTLLRVARRVCAAQALEVELDRWKQTCEALAAERDRLLGLLGVRAGDGDAAPQP